MSALFRKERLEGQVQLRTVPKTWAPARRAAESSTCAGDSLDSFRLGCRCGHRSYHERIVGWNPDDYQSEFETRLTEALHGNGPSPAKRSAIGRELVEITHRALDLYHANRTARGTFRALNWVLPGLSAIASAVGGSVLAADRLTGWLRLIVGGASLLGGIAGGLVSVLKPAEELTSHEKWVQQYEAIWREAWHFAINQLPDIEIDAAIRKLEEIRTALAAVEGDRAT